MYYRPETGQVFATHAQIRDGMPNVGFNENITDDALEYNNVFPLVYEKPEAAPGKVAVPYKVTKVDGVWTQLWTERDATPEELEAMKPPVPQSVTRRQARQALLLRGVLDKIEPAIAQIPDATQRGLALIEWQDSLNFERNRPLVVQIGALVGLDAKGLDDLFIFASKL